MVRGQSLVVEAAVADARLDLVLVRVAQGPPLVAEVGQALELKELSDHLESGTGHVLLLGRQLSPRVGHGNKVPLPTMIRQGLQAHQ